MLPRSYAPENLSKFASSGLGQESIYCIENAASESVVLIAPAEVITNDLDMGIATILK